MKKKYYIPTRLPERVIWLNKFALALATHGPAFGISAGEIAAAQQWAVFYAWLIGYLDYINGFKQGVKQFKDRFSVATTGTPLGVLPGFSPAAAPAMPTEAGIFSLIGGIAKRIKGN